MGLFWWRNRVIESAEPCVHRDECCHVVRNAVIGIQRERKLIAQSLVAIGQYQDQIERALRESR